jgi:hypothetical protein
MQNRGLPAGHTPGNWNGIAAEKEKAVDLPGAPGCTIMARIQHISGYKRENKDQHHNCHLKICYTSLPGSGRLKTKSLTLRL